jgi:putative membrane protein
LTQIGRIIANAATFNALLGIGLIVSFIAREQGYLLKIYLLVSIIIAGIVGGVTLKPTVAVLQSGPAAIALALILLAPGAA